MPSDWDISFSLSIDDSSGGIGLQAQLSDLFNSDVATYVVSPLKHDVPQTTSIGSTVPGLEAWVAPGPEEEEEVVAFVRDGVSYDYKSLEQPETLGWLARLLDPWTIR